MKKTYFTGIILLILISGLFGGFFYLKNNVRVNYEKNVEAIEKIPGIRVVSSSLNEGFFSASSVVEIAILKEYSNRLIGLSQEVGIQDDIILRINNLTKYSFASLFGSFKNIGSVEVVNEPYKSQVEDFFGSPKFMTFSSVGAINGSTNVSNQILPINFKDKNISIDTSALNLGGKIDKNGNILNIFINQDALKLSINGAEFSYNNLKYNVDLKTPLAIDDIKNKIYFGNNKSSSSISELKFSNNTLGNIVLSKIKTNGNMVVNDGNANVDDKLDIGNMAFSGLGGFELNSLHLNLSFKNLNKLAIQEVQKYLNSQRYHSKQHNSTDSLMEQISKLLSSKPSLSINELSVKNSAGKKMFLTLNLGLSEKTPQDDKNLINNIGKFIVFNAKYRSNASIADFFGNKSNKIKNDFDDINKNMLKAGILIKDNDEFKSDFVYDPSKMDIIINNKISLGELIYQ